MIGVLLTLVVVFGSLTARGSWQWFGLPLVSGKTLPYGVVAPSDPSVTYAFSEMAGVWRSDDGGMTWNSCGIGLRPEQISRGADWIRGLSVDNRDSQRITLLAGRDALAAETFVSFDGGLTYTQTGCFAATVRTVEFGQASGPVPPAPVVPYAVACDPFDSSRVLVGCESGVYASENGCKAFFWRPDVPGVSIAWSRTVPGVALAVGGKREVSVWASEDGGKTWLQTGGTGLPSMRAWAVASFSVTADPRADAFYVTMSGRIGEGGGIYETRDRGRSWVWFGEGLPSGEWLFKSDESECGYDSELVISPDGLMVARAPKNRKVYYRDAGDGLWKPSDGGVDGRRQVAADPFSPGRFVQCGSSSLLESTDGGRTFLAMPGAPGDWRHLAFDPHVRGLFAAAEVDHLVLSRDGGRTFSVVREALEIPCGGAYQFELDRGRFFYLTRGCGVYATDDACIAVMPEFCEGVTVVHDGARVREASSSQIALDSEIWTMAESADIGLDSTARPNFLLFLR